MQEFGNLIFLLSKFAGSSKFWLNFFDTHGSNVDSAWISPYLHINLVSVERGVICLSDNVKKMTTF